ncbi:hypothetical protein HCJ21_11840 [Listeria seeligeri]|uniref:hypothetical protein n=2 Tax=Listeria seeligeri TaxID=1640 RepID=UPI00162A755E|nr:hypothetical protein [Listeria seeligeri]MBC1580439.1 hypothetical protein [Listeria seeligeri]MBC1599975.1 hypothetical protein [Listeria seeligeri]MBC2045246.1 hypothetical protein [Listeria seeligeri]MBC2051752.1 hypothetical protein [Listeria seeligeri]MBC2060205.1 hypothetical protein [Listeria seeligeri]
MLRRLQMLFNVLFTPLLLNGVCFFEQKTRFSGLSAVCVDFNSIKVEGFVKAEYTYTNTQERAENVLPFITAEMVPYFQQVEITSDSKNVVKVQSNLTKQEIGHYFLEGEKCQVTVRAWSAFQVDNQKKTENQVLLDLELVKIETGKWFIDSQEIATIQ